MNVRRWAALDLAATRAIRSLPHDPHVDRALAALSQATDHGRGWLIFGLAGAAIDRARRCRWLAATARVMAVELVTRQIKRALPRDRPTLPALAPLATTPSPLSFPSSHTADAVAAACTYGALLPQRPLWLLAAVQAASRPYLGVHYPSDVVGGAALGLLLGGTARTTRVRRRRRDQSGGAQQSRRRTPPRHRYRRRRRRRPTVRRG